MSSQSSKYSTNSFKAEYPPLITPPFRSPPLSTFEPLALTAAKNFHAGVATDWSYKIPNGGYIGMGDSEKAARIGTTISSDKQNLFAQGYVKVSPKTTVTGDVQTTFDSDGLAKASVSAGAFKEFNINTTAGIKVERTLDRRSTEPRNSINFWALFRF